MTTSPVLSITDELLSELRHAESAHTDGFVRDTARSALLHIRSLTEQLAAANEKIDKAWNQPCSSTLDLEGYIPGALDAWKRPVRQHLPYDFSGKPDADSTQYCNGWNDAGGYWKRHVISLTERLEKAEKDAARYRHIKSAWETSFLEYLDGNVVPEKWDAVVDAAIAQEGTDHE